MKNVSRFRQGETVCAVGRCVTDVDPAIGAPLCTYHAKLVFAKVAHIYGMVPPERTKARPVQSILSPIGTVYIAQHGDRIKIGFTRNLKERLRAVKVERVIASFPGRIEAERELHERFAHLRTVGEWFVADPELIAYAEALEANKASASA